MKTAQTKNITAVQLGRFAPYHFGHQKVTEAMIKKYGMKNCLLMIGSSNVVNTRTPYTFKFRKELIHRIFPNIEIIPLPDINPELLHFETSTLNRWLNQIKEIEEKRNTKFIFCGGIKKDLEYIKGFLTEVIVDRNIEGKRISSSLVRKLIKEGEHKKLYRVVNPEVVPMLLSYKPEF